MYEIKWIDKEKRFGMFAACDIISGTVILTESPIITLPKAAHRSNVSSDDWIKNEFESLSDSDKQKVLSLHNNLQQSADDDQSAESVEIYRTNAYLFTDHPLNESGLFPLISRINHSCFPNCQFVDNPKSDKHSIISLFGIQSGDEITHSYIDLDLFMADCAKRTKYIFDNYGFECRCDECVLFKKRDRFRKQYKKFEHALDDAFDQMDSEKVVEISNKMIEIIKHKFNGYPPLLSQCLMKGAEAKLHQAKYEEVVECMKKSTKLDLIYYGDACDLNDIKQCKVMLPTKWQKTFPWDHVLGTGI